MKRVLILFLLLFSTLLFGCGISISHEVAGTEKQPQSNAVTGGKKMELSYATGFSVDYNDDGSYTVTAGGEEPVLIDGKKKNIYLASSAAMDLFLKADAIDSIKMTSTKEGDWTLPEVASAIGSGDMKYIGKYSAPDFETIVNDGCDLVIENTMIYHSPKTKEQLEALGIPVIVDTSSYEEHVLGRIEWIKLYGLLTGHESEADAFFEDAKKRMEAVKNTPPTGKSVAFFYVTRSGYVNTRKPGDYISELIDMAGGKYVPDSFSDENDNKLSTMNIDVESFYDMAHDCDVIIYNSTITGAPETMDELLSEAPFLSDFKAVKTGEVWCTGSNMFQMTGELPAVAEELVNVIAGDDDEGLSFFKKLR